MPESIIEVSRRHREALLRRDAAASRRMATSYRRSLVRVTRHMETLLVDLRRRIAAGESFSPDRIRRWQRVAWLKAQITAELSRWTEGVQPEIEGLQRKGGEQGIRDAEAQVRAQARPDLKLPRVTFGAEAGEGQGPFWRVLHPRAVEEMVGQLSDGSPLRDSLQRLVGDALELVDENLENLVLHGAETAEQELIDGMIRGFNPRKVARRIGQKLAGQHLTRALTIARTEHLRAYRSASQQQYIENRHIVRGYRRIEKLDDRTCVICWALHGQEFAVGETFATHPNCRGVMVPILHDEYGFQATVVEPGPVIFERLPEDKKMLVLGPRAHEMYEAGELTLEDLVGLRNDPRWGPVTYRIPLKVLDAGASRRAG